MNTMKKKYMSPLVEQTPISAMRFLCASGDPATDIPYSGTGAGAAGQNTPF